MKFAKLVFLIGGILGLLSTVPLFFNESVIAPELKHPEFYYGFIGINLMWQVLYIYISTNPLRFRPIMVVSFFVKILGVISVFWLIRIGRTDIWWYRIIFFDFLFAILFLLSFGLTRKFINTEKKL